MANGQTAAVTPTWGAPQWEFTFQRDVDSSTVEVPAGTPIAVDESTGRSRSSLDSRGDGNSRSGPSDRLTSDSTWISARRAAVGAGVVGAGYFGVASGAGDVEFVRLETQQFMRFPIPAADGFDPASPPLRVGGVVIVAARAGEITAVDLGSGRPRWTAHAVGPLRGARPAVWDGP